MNVRKHRLGPLLALTIAPLFAWGQETPMTGKELQDAWAGKELVGTANNGSRIFMRLETDGKATVSVGSTSDTGTWRTVDNGYCAKWTRIRAGEERCFTVLKSGGTFKVLNPDGSTNGIINAVR